MNDNWGVKGPTKILGDQSNLTRTMVLAAKQRSTLWRYLKVERLYNSSSCKSYLVKSLIKIKL